MAGTTPPGGVTRRRRRRTRSTSAAALKGARVGVQRGETRNRVYTTCTRSEAGGICKQEVVKAAGGRASSRDVAQPMMMMMMSGRRSGAMRCARPSGGARVCVFGPHTRRVHAYAASSGSGDGQQQHVDKIMEKIRALLRRTAQSGGEVVEDVRRWVWLRDEQFGVSRAARRAARQAQFQMDELDRRFSVRENVSRISRDIIENAPREARKLSNQLSTFSKTPLGSLVGIGVFVYLIMSGLLFRIINTLFIALWAMTLLSPLLLRLVNKDAFESDDDGFGGAYNMRQQQQRQQQRQQQQQQQQQGWSRPQNGRRQRWSRGSDPDDDDGLVIDADWKPASDD